MGAKCTSSYIHTIRPEDLETHTCRHATAVATAATFTRSDQRILKLVGVTLERHLGATFTRSDQRILKPVIEFATQLHDGSYIHTIRPEDLETHAGPGTGQSHDGYIHTIRPEDLETSSISSYHRYGTATFTRSDQRILKLHGQQTIQTDSKATFTRSDQRILKLRNDQSGTQYI